jgi:hypothetical protein
MVENPIIKEITVGLTADIGAALEALCRAKRTKASIYAREAIYDALVRDHFLAQPTNGAWQREEQACA